MQNYPSKPEAEWWKHVDSTGPSEYLVQSTGKDQFTKDPAKNFIGQSEYLVQSTGKDQFTKDPAKNFIGQKLSVKAAVATNYPSAPAAGAKFSKNYLSKLTSTKMTRPEDFDCTEQRQHQKRGVAKDKIAPIVNLSHSRKVPLPPCRLQVCHDCRPLFSNRLYMSFESVFQDEYPPVTVEESATLRTANANALRRSKAQSRVSSPAMSKEGSEFSSRGSQSFGESASVQTDKDDDQTTVESLYPGGSILNINPIVGPRMYPSFIACQEAIRIAQQVPDLRSPTLRGPFSEDDRSPFEPAGTFPKIIGSVDHASFESCEDEVDVDGGVALTEEAVETHTPDLVTE